MKKTILKQGSEKDFMNSVDTINQMSNGSDNKERLAYKILKRMKYIREVELRISNEYPQQEIRCPVHLSIGQESPSACLSLLIKRSDFSVSTHRGHAHYLAKGGCLKKMIAELYGKESGCSAGKGGSMHLIDISAGFMGTSAIVGNSIPTGTGLAHAAKLNRKGQISVIHFGDGAIEEGAFYESLNYACVQKLPALFFCENNFYSVYSPLSVRQPKGRSICSIAESIGSRVFAADGKDIEECHKIIKESIEYVRGGNGPGFIEIETYRTLEHCGPFNDDNLKYRPENEVRLWTNKDPITKEESLLNEREREDYKKYCKKLEDNINLAFECAKLDAHPSQESLYKDIYEHV